MKKFVLAYNPVSGHAEFKRRLDAFIAAFQKRGAMVIPYRTKRENQDFDQFVAEANPDGILAAGGDGTVHILANLMLHGRIDLPLGIIGSGTSNDFATNLHLNDDLGQYLDSICEGITRPVDLGRVGEEYFVNVVSAGMMTGIAHEVNARLKNALGKMAYYLRGIGELPRMHSFPMHLVADGRAYDMDAFLFLIINSATVGSMRDVAAAARVDDGMLDFLAVKRGSAMGVAALTADLFQGKPVDQRSSVLHVQARTFDISAEEPLTSDLDGEIGPQLPLHVETVPHALEIFCL
ncbi:MAG: YegS/Rv2252/BmrU family lipid kinase [Selenomonadaceae bacterium]|nr:YegS/Rv2252/BmrU family lipid kinase [Selenomonadaceae bacterium]